MGLFESKNLHNILSFKEKKDFNDFFNALQFEQKEKIINNLDSFMKASLFGIIYESLLIS
jgi:hypothetical protein